MTASRRKRKHEEHENHERWLVSYADFITLLFAFFTVLYATSQADLEKQKDFQESFKKVMAGLNAGGTGGQGDETSAFDSFKHESAIRMPLDSFPRRGAGSAEIQNYVERKLDKTLGESGKDTVTAVRHDAVGVKIQLAANKLFSAGSAEISDDSAAALDRVGELLKESGRNLIVEGHTDDLPIRSEKYPTNWELSAARATKIVRYLMAVHKISGERLTAVAYADQKPVAPNDSPENRARNRRIEIMITTGEK
ncbi:MAG: OmpA family protein [Bdellovibrionota bacterium]